MSSTLEQTLAALLQTQAHQHLRDIKRGLEKESLRVTAEGRLAQTPHPTALGSTLTHPYITTDYSEALLEFITPVCDSMESLLGFLDEIHRFALSQMNDERMWVNSMPGPIADELEVPIAEYGNSNVGRMKHIYRVGLWKRYGRRMQTIAGIHYNLSFPETFWQALQKIEQSNEPLQDYISRRYFDLLRNFHRWYWLLILLFGASPAISENFIAEDTHRLLKKDRQGLYRNTATSLRMSDLGYQNNSQSGLHISYDSLDAYVRTLNHAIHTPEPNYLEIGVQKDGAYQQLNANILQIENEFYSPIRPKRNTEPNERPTQALKRAGVEYIEVRVLDLDPFNPLGIGPETLRFVDLFVTFCLLEPSPLVHAGENIGAKQNGRQVVYNGQDPSAKLQRECRQINIHTWAKDLLKRLEPLVELFDSAHGGSQYRDTFRAQWEKLDNPSLLPAAQVLSAMREENLDFPSFGLKMAEQHYQHFRNRPLSDERQQFFAQAAATSLQQFQALEQADDISFEDYLANYFAD